MTAVAEPRPFAVAGPLPPEGITVVEASAGTGKTYTLTSLVVRFVGDGVPLSDVLAVTFTKMATGELRDRIRSRLVEAHRMLGDHLGRSGAVPDDDALAPMVRGPRGEVEVRRGRLADALADFDAATIATTHGFCQLVLYGLGTAGDAWPGTTLLEDPADLMEEVVDDLYLRRSLLHPTDQPPFSLAQARQAAFEATRNPDARLVPAGGDDERGLLRRLAEKARGDIGRRLLEESQLTYDQLLFRLARTLDDPERGPEACRRLAERYRVVLVDEFQDTDPVQWTVLQRAFSSGRTRLVLIGDPKQAVYGFRGADVHAYLEAAEAAQAFYTLDTNWRADQPLLDATAALFDPLQFGHASISFRSVRAPAARQSPGLRGAGGAPMRWRLVGDHQKGIAVTTKGLAGKGPLREWIARDVAADLARLLRSGAEVGEGGEWRPLLEKDVAVLTRTNAQALAVRDALRAEGVASVVAGLDSVFRSDAAQAWLRLLEALQEPSSRSRAAAVALGPFVGLGRTAAAMAPEARWEALHDQLHRWAAVVANRGISGLYGSVTVEQGLPGRLLAVTGGERMLTDLGHVAQLLHAETGAHQLGAPSLRNWLAARIRSVAAEQSEAEDRSRRLDSDAEAVQVLTVHGAKGLEFPVVYCPYMWDAGPPERRSPPVLFHDPDAGGIRTLDVGGPARDGAARQSYLEHAAWARAERRAEDLRLLYVALTRARHRLVIWWGRTQDCRHSPLGRLLIGRDHETGRVRDARGGEPTSKQVRAALDAIAARAPGLIDVEVATDRDRVGSQPAPHGSPRSAPLLVAAPFTRDLDLRWGRGSYSSMTAALHDGRGEVDLVGSEPERRGLTDEPADALGLDGDGLSDARPGAGAGIRSRQLVLGTEDTAGLAMVSPLAGLAGGPAVGTFVHRVLEVVDFAAPDLTGALRHAVHQCAQIDFAAAAADTGPLVEGLEAAITTPLDPLIAGTSLSDVPRRDRLDELTFELPVAGGDRPTGSVRTAHLAEVLGARLADDDRLHGYPRRLLDPLLDTTLRGYLTGSLDLVFRRGTGDGDERWYVVDYKSNWLGTSAASLRLGDYAPSQLDDEMDRRHYPLQALIYLVALHRYLCWRRRGYQPDRHLGGVLYLFVRGMAGPDTPVVDGSRCGVWSWAPPPGLVPALSDLFGHGGPGTAP
jgi:exodeoxyribonuclease V beta subunit